MTKPFIITKVSWILQTKGMEGFEGSVVDYHYYLAKFLQDNDLTLRKLVKSKSDIGHEFEISSDDLTDEGMQVLRLGLDKWGEKVDNGASPKDTSILAKVLDKIRS